MSEMKHFVVYNGQNQNANTDIQDQGLHELYLTPYEGGFVDGRAAATMCSYQIWRDTSTNPALVDPISALSTTSPLSPYAKPGENPQTWPLNESHYSCEQPLSLTHVLRDTWGSQALVGSDYPATHSTSSIMQGEDQEMPTSNGFLSANHTLTASQQVDATGSTCADAAGSWVDCSTPGAAHVGGIPNGFQNSGGSGCTNTYGCPLVDAVLTGNLPLSVFNQALARILYEEERFGMLGCDQTPVSSSCTNPGGVGGDRTGAANLPAGGDGQLGTKYGDAAIVERYSEEGATLLENEGDALPITSADLAGGILVAGGNANHTVADPTNEASTGFIGRNAINPLQQLKDLSGNPNAFTFVPANDPVGQPVPTSVLSTDTSGNTFGGLNLSADGGPAAQDSHPIDHTKVNGNQLAPGTYTWSGFLYVPTADTYTFAIQQSPSFPTTLNCPQTGQFGTPQAEPNQQPLTLCTAFTAANASQTNTPPDAVTFTLDGTRLNLNATTANVYGATVPSTPTNAAYTEQGLISRTCATGTAALEPGTTNCTAAQPSLSPGYHQIQITVDNATNCLATPPAAAAGTNPAVAAVLAPCGQASFRFAFSRVNSDIADAAAAAAGKSKAIVFVNDSDATGTTPNPDGTATTISAVRQLSPANVNLINAVAAANANTIVVINNQNPVVTPWLGNVKSLLDMWFAGQEGGTSTARILLGLANPGGHSALTWPVNPTDTIWAYDEPANGLYPGSTAGRHPVRLRALVHDLRLLEAEGRANGRRRRRRGLQGREHRLRCRSRRGPGLRRASERLAERRPVRGPVARAVRPRRARRRRVQERRAGRHAAAALVLVGRGAAVGARRRRAHDLRRRRRRIRPPASPRDLESGEEEPHLLEPAVQRYDDRRQPDRQEGRLVRSRPGQGEREPAPRADERRPDRRRHDRGEPRIRQGLGRRRPDELGRERDLQHHDRRQPARAQQCGRRGVAHRRLRADHGGRQRRVHPQRRHREHDLGLGDSRQPDVRQERRSRRRGQHGRRQAREAVRRPLARPGPQQIASGLLAALCGACLAGCGGGGSSPSQVDREP